MKEEKNDERIKNGEIEGVGCWVFFPLSLNGIYNYICMHAVYNSSKNSWDGRKWLREEKYYGNIINTKVRDGVLKVEMFRINFKILGD